MMMVCLFDGDTCIPLLSIHAHAGWPAARSSNHCAKQSQTSRVFRWKNRRVFARLSSCLGKHGRRRIRHLPPSHNRWGKESFFLLVNFIFVLTFYFLFFFFSFLFLFFYFLFFYFFFFFFFYFYNFNRFLLIWHI